MALQGVLGDFRLFQRVVKAYQCNLRCFREFHEIFEGVLVVVSRHFKVSDVVCGVIHKLCHATKKFSHPSLLYHTFCMGPHHCLYGPSRSANPPPLKKNMT